VYLTLNRRPSCDAIQMPVHCKLIVSLNMLANPQPPDTTPRKSVFRNPLLYSSAVLIIVAAYVGVLVLSRRHENQQIDRQAAQNRAEKQLEQDRIAIEQLGGKDLAIQMFYADPGVIHPGQTVQLCYGVANAKTVILEPQDSPVWPSPNRCVDVSPHKTTTYVLTIDDGSGHTQSQSLTVSVR
jgi:hypothetical protein